MKAMKPVRVTARGDWYMIKGPAELKRALSAIEWPKEKPFMNFIFPKVALRAIKKQSLRLPRNYMMSINCEEGRGGIKVPPLPSSFAGIETRPPKNLSEYKRLNRLELKQLLKKEGKRAGYSPWNDYKTYEKEVMPKAKALLFFRKGKFAGLAAHFKSDIPYIGVCDHLGWHSDFKGFSPAERRSAEYQQALWMKNTAKRGLSVFSGGLTGKHYNFLLGLGLYVRRIRLERI